MFFSPKIVSKVPQIFTIYINKKKSGEAGYAPDPPKSLRSHAQVFEALGFTHNLLAL